MASEAHISERSAPEAIDLSKLFSRILKSIRRTWLLGMALLITLGLLGYIYAARNYSPRYTASASFVVSSNSGASLSASSYYDQASTMQLTATFPYILSSSALQAVVAEDLGLSYIPGVITPSMEGNTNLFQLSVTASDPQMAYDILQSVVKNYPVVARHVIGNTTLKLLDESGVPTAPSNPYAPLRTVLQGAILGLILYLLLVTIIAVNQRTVMNKEDLEKYLSVKHLSTIPYVHVKNRSKNRQNTILVDHSSVSNDYFRSIETTQLRLSRILKNNRWKTVLLTSALMGEGKTTTACNIAMMFAQKGYRVLLIDGDLRNPSVSKCLNQPDWEDTKGLYHFLAGEADLSAVVHQYQDTSLYVIPAGYAVPEVSNLYSNGLLEELIAQCRDKADLIIMDTPPSTFMNDTPLAAPYFDAGVIVIRQDYAHVNRIMSCAEILAQSGLPLAGCVINGETFSQGKYGYGKYSYSRYGYRKYGYGKYGYGTYASHSPREE